MKKQEIEELIPHREPFLLLDEVREIDSNRVLAIRVVSPDEDVFRGHYPEYPIFPGVLVIEAVLQAGALLLAVRMRDCVDPGVQGVPVVSRIRNAKFKRQVRPGDVMHISATFKERLANAWFLTGKVQVDGKTAVTVDFSVAAVAKKDK